MGAIGKREAVERFAVAMDLFSAGCEMMERKLRRENPDAGDEEIRILLNRWLQTRPGAEFGDAEGTPGTRFRPDVSDE